MYKSIIFLSLVLILKFNYISADGGFFFVEAGVGYSADQQAILIFDSNAKKQTLILSTGQDWDNPKKKSDYAWVIPVPSLMNQNDFTVFNDSVGVFEQLYDLTEPRGTIYHKGFCGGPFGCASDNASVVVGVSELVSFELENYKIHVLSADSSNNLQIWLNNNGYKFSPQDTTVLQYYINKGWYFNAVKMIMPNTTSGTGGGTPKRPNPLQMTFNTDKPVYPLYISSVSSRDDSPTEILLYVFAPYRVEVDGFKTIEMSRIEDEKYSTEDEFKSIYQQKFRRLIANAGGKAFIVEYADSVRINKYTLPSLKPVLDKDTTYFLTRLRTEILPEKMNDDVRFVQAPNNSTFQITFRFNSTEYNKVRFASISFLFIIFALIGTLKKKIMLYLKIYLLLSLLFLLIV